NRTVTVTTDDMQKKKNDVKARTTLLLSLPDEHQLRFSKYKTAKELWDAIPKTFGGNKATKKRKNNLLKQQYGNFKAEGTETLEQTFNRLQVIVSQLQFMDVEVENDDLNQKFLASLAPEWLMHTIKKKKDVKARTTLLLFLPDEHQLRFSKYKTTRELWAAVLITFGGGNETKKRKKKNLKQQQDNFKAEGTETLEQTFNRLQVIVCQQ
nr:hypothetical protein [Tanacetum cinerariifolium]